MAFSLKRLLIIFVPLLIVAGAAIFYTSNLKESPPPKQPETSSAVFVTSDTSQTTTTEVDEVHSPDGKMNLIMEKVINNETSAYSFFVLEISTPSRKLILEKTVPAGSIIEMSPNAWSPDNKYVFIGEISPSYRKYLVFNASAEPFSSGEQYIDVVPSFVAKETDYILSEITGWDSPTLLHVYTTTNDGARGPSYWFEVPSKAIIQLASR